MSTIVSTNVVKRELIIDGNNGIMSISDNPINQIDTLTSPVYNPYNLVDDPELTDLTKWNYISSGYSANPLREVNIYTPSSFIVYLTLVTSSPLQSILSPSLYNCVGCVSEALSVNDEIGCSANYFIPCYPEQLMTFSIKSSNRGYSTRLLVKFYNENFTEVGSTTSASNSDYGTQDVSTWTNQVINLYTEFNYKYCKLFIKITSDLTGGTSYFPYSFILFTHPFVGLQHSLSSTTNLLPDPNITDIGNYFSATFNASSPVLFTILPPNTGIQESSITTQQDTVEPTTGDSYVDTGYVINDYVSGTSGVSTTTPSSAVSTSTDNALALVGNYGTGTYLTIGNTSGIALSTTDTYFQSYVYVSAENCSISAKILFYKYTTTALQGSVLGSKIANALGNFSLDTWTRIDLVGQIPTGIDYYKIQITAENITDPSKITSILITKPFFTSVFSQDFLSYKSPFLVDPYIESTTYQGRGNSFEEPYNWPNTVYFHSKLPFIQFKQFISVPSVTFPELIQNVYNWTQSSGKCSTTSGSVNLPTQNVTVQQVGTTVLITPVCILFIAGIAYANGYTVNYSGGFRNIFATYNSATNQIRIGCHTVAATGTIPSITLNNIEVLLIG